MAPIAERHRRALAPDEYAALVERTRAVACAHVPPGATVAVVSRGDDALLALDGRSGWHFPRAASGAYAGHHPHDGAAALAHLEQVRSGGAGYLVVPDCARWWLDHYEALAEHLRERCTLLADDDACAVYALTAAAAAAAAAAAQPADATAAPVDPATGARLHRFLDALLPERCHVLLARREWQGLELPERAVVALPDGAQPALAALEHQRGAGDPAYLVVPLAGDPPDWIDELLAEVERTREPLAARAQLAAVYDVHPDPDPGTSHR
jgi:hypothetical protein